MGGSLSLSILSLLASLFAANVQATSLTVRDEGIDLRLTSFETQFSSNGVTVTPNSGPVWQWSLLTVNGHQPESCKPRVADSNLVSYRRGGVEEQYVIREDSIEQRFIVHEEWLPKKASLEIRGQVRCSGLWREVANGWEWMTPKGAVFLGDVTVFDRLGREIAASMDVDAGSTCIRVLAEDLEGAAFPLLVDPEIGANDFRISDMGVDGEFSAGAIFPAIAYNETRNEYLVVWCGDDVVDNKFEIYGQRLDATDGSEIGTDFQISEMGPPGNPDFNAYFPAVAYNPIDDGYLIVWHGDDGQDGRVDNEVEVFGQLLDGDGSLLGARIRISSMGPDGSSDYVAVLPSVAFSPDASEYLVVWQGDDDRQPLVDGEFEIFAQRLSASGVEVGLDDFRVSDMGPDGHLTYAALMPDVVWNGDANEYLVAWHGDDVDGEFTIFVQRLEEDGGEVGSNDIRISTPGDSVAVAAKIAWNLDQDEYVVVWHETDDDGNFEIFGQRLGASGTEIGLDDFRISDMGSSPGDFDGYAPQISFNSVDGEYLVVWHGDDDEGGLVNGEIEVFAQRLDGVGADPIGANDERISDMGPDGDTRYGVHPIFATALAFDSVDGDYLVVWSGNDDGAYEIYGQRMYATSFFSLRARPETVHAGDVLEFETGPGLNGTAALLMVTDVNGSPTLSAVTQGVIGPELSWVLSAPAPGGLGGLVVTFQSFGFDLDGTVVVSDPAVVTFE